MLQVFTQGATRADIESAIDESVKQRHGQSIKELLKTEGKSVWGLKDPQLIDHLDALKKFLPQARFIIIIRDARAVVRSYIENAWGLGTNCYTGALRWKREVQAQLVFAKEFEDYVTIIRFEDLIRSPSQCLREVCRLIDVPFDETMLDYTNKKSFVSRNRQSINTFKVPDTAMIDKWKTELTSSEIRIINIECGELLDKLGYEKIKNHGDISKWLKIYYLIHQMILGEVQIQYHWRVARYKRIANKVFYKNPVS